MNESLRHGIEAAVLLKRRRLALCAILIMSIGQRPEISPASYLSRQILRIMCRFIQSQYVLCNSKFPKHYCRPETVSYQPSISELNIQKRPF